MFGTDYPYVTTAPNLKGLREALKDDDLKAVEKECQALGARTLSTLADVSKPDDVNRIVPLI